jgi:hypothetical protein
MDHLPRLVGELGQLEEIDLESGLRFDRAPRAIGEAARLRDFARAGVLAARRAADDEDAGGRGGIGLPFRSLKNRGSCLQPLDRKLETRIGKLRPRGLRARRLAVLDVAVPGDLAHLLELRLDGVECRVVEPLEEPAAELLARQGNVLRHLAHGGHEGSCL